MILSYSFALTKVGNDLILSTSNLGSGVIDLKRLSSILLVYLLSLLPLSLKCFLSFTFIFFTGGSSG